MSHNPPEESPNIDLPLLETSSSHPELFLLFHRDFTPKEFELAFPEGIEFKHLPECDICSQRFSALQFEREKQIELFLRAHEEPQISLPKKLRKKMVKHLKRHLYEPIEIYFAAQIDLVKRYHENATDKSWPLLPQNCACARCNLIVENWRQSRSREVRLVLKKFNLRLKEVDAFLSFCLSHSQEDVASLLLRYIDENKKAHKLFFEAIFKILKRNLFSTLLKKYQLPSTSINALLNQIEPALQKKMLLSFLATEQVTLWQNQIAEELELFVARFAEANPDLIELEKERQELEVRLISATNMKSPHLYYKKARTFYRDIIFHIGPTNAGKTHHAFEALRTAKNGQYLAPLRLLAQEGQDKLAQFAVPTNLITGEERDLVPEATHISSTIEMADLNHTKDVAVIDEIQMINDPDRGWAWTRALLGFPAKEIHLCGTEEVAPLVESLVQQCGDFLTKKYYHRLTPLHVTPEPVPLTKLQPGDAVIAFSRKKLHELKFLLKQQGLTTSMVYGALPPEVRRSQAALFNARKNEILLATDAIGMGLNLNINRVIFWEINKHYNQQVYELSPSEILQIGGRAGRFGFHDVGYVSGINRYIHRKVKDAFGEKLKPNTTMRAGLKPEFSHIQALQEAAGFGDLPSLLLEFSRRASTDASLYQMCRLDDMIELARMTRPETPLEERFIFCCAPVDLRCTLPGQLFRQMIQGRIKGEPVFLNIKLPQLRSSHENMMMLQSLEEKVKTIDVYLWLAYRYPESFPSLEEAIRLRSLASSLINEILSHRPKPQQKKKKKK